MTSLFSSKPTKARGIHMYRYILRSTYNSTRAMCLSVEFRTALSLLVKVGFLDFKAGFTGVKSFGKRKDPFTTTTTAAWSLFLVSLSAAPLNLSRRKARLMMALFYPCWCRKGMRRRLAEGNRRDYRPRNLLHLSKAVLANATVRSTSTNCTR